MLTLVLLVKIGTSKLVTASLTAANFNDPRPTRKLVLTKGKAYVGSCSSEITSGFAMTLRELPHKHSDPPSPTLPLKFAAGCTRTFSIPAKTCFVMTTPPPPRAPQSIHRVHAYKQNRPLPRGPLNCKDSCQLHSYALTPTLLPQCRSPQ